MFMCQKKANILNAPNFICIQKNMYLFSTNKYSISLSLYMSRYDILIVGGGLSGAVMAERFANVLNNKVLI